MSRRAGWHVVEAGATSTVRGRAVALDDVVCVTVDGEHRAGFVDELRSNYRGGPFGLELFVALPDAKDTVARVFYDDRDRIGPDNERCSFECHVEIEELTRARERRRQQRPLYLHWVN